MLKPTTLHFLSTPTLLLGIALLSACSKPPEPAAAAAPTVARGVVRFSAQAPELQRLVTVPVTAAKAETFSLPARLAWDEDHTSRVTAPLAGRLLETLVQAGASVRAGQPLAYLASAEMGSAQSDAARAQADADLADRSLARAKALAEAGIIAGKDLEQAQGDRTRTHAEAQRTALRLKSLGVGSATDPRVSEKYGIRSPLAGVVVERNTNPGMEWRPDQAAPALFVISDPSYLWCWIDAPESAIGLLHVGQTLHIRSSAWPDDRVDAEIDQVSDALDPVSHTLKVRAHLRNPQRHLKAEMFVNAELSQLPAGRLDIPATAVFLSDAAQQVFVKTGSNEFSRRVVTVVSRSAGRVRVNDGLREGDQVVVDGALYLQQLLESAKASHD